MANIDVALAKTLAPNEISDAFTAAALAAADVAVVEFDGKDHQTYFLFGGATKKTTITVKSGDGIQGVTDIAFTIGAGEYKFFTLDSGYFKQVNNDNKGKVLIEVDGALNLWAMEARV